jgi:hypothetical protein
MKTIFYSVDLQNLLNIQEKEVQKNQVKKEQDQVNFLDKKERLLKIVLPLVHGMVSLHNYKCISGYAKDYPSLKKGLISDLGKVDLDTYISKNYLDSNSMFSSCGGTVSVALDSYPNGNSKSLKVWLNDSKCSTMRVTPELGYSMSTFKEGKVYGSGIEDELKALAKYCAKFTDNW